MDLQYFSLLLFGKDTRNSSIPYIPFVKMRVTIDEYFVQDRITNI